MFEMHDTTIESASDEVLMHRLFDLARGQQGNASELARIDALVYVRFAQAYGSVIPELQAA
ncbi:MAG: hypothetical protein M3Q40_10810 [Pseudomonadota bacterium]|nr:hypothetical protein [Pseudomonadota bacterium]